MTIVIDRKWWKESVMYQIYPRSFMDSNNDGIGDIRGIIDKVDHIASLGVDIIWLSPVYMSPNDDNGYDISDYTKIHPEFGTMEDLEELLNILHSKGMKLIMDLVVNHSSDEHQWFLEAKKSKDNPYRNYYHWYPGKNDQEPNNWVSFFGGSAWEYDENTDEYYLHLFTRKQPDLNWENPKVREEIYKMMRFWLDKGIDGFRMDVISLISKPEDFGDGDISEFNKLLIQKYANGPRIHEYLKEMHEKVLSHYDIMTVGEGPGITKELANDYIGKDRNELNMIFQLDLMFIDFGPEGKFDYQPFKRREVKQLLMAWDHALGDEGWNNIFLDNHDFPRLVSRFGNDKEFRIQSAKLFAILLLTFKGTPCIYQGTEIGMTNVKFDGLSEYRDVETLNMYQKYVVEGDMNEADFLKIAHIQGRDNVRTPMQWNDSENAGFSEGDPWIKVNPNFREINVEKDKESDDSIFSFYQDLLHFRKNNLALIYGSLTDHDPDHDFVLAYSRKLEGKGYFIICNMSNESLDYHLPNNLDLNKILKSNYSDSTILNSKATMRPWEAMIIRIET